MYAELHPVISTGRRKTNLFHIDRRGFCVSERSRRKVHETLPPARRTQRGGVTVRRVVEMLLVYGCVSTERTRELRKQVERTTVTTLLSSRWGPTIPPLAYRR